jgi:CubicO group peptidase (beta-lactamase class C family)
VKGKKMKNHVRLLAILVVLSLAIGYAGSSVITNLSGIPTSDSLPLSSPTLVSTPPLSSPYWPTEGWRSSTPEQQGLDSEVLAEMIEYIRDEALPIHSVLVIRNGYIVTEAYFYPFQPDFKHRIYSCTKSFTSALVGIAIEKGYIDGVDHPVLDYFSERTIANIDQRKKTITLEHLLTMTPGMEWQSSWRGDRDSTLQMFRSEDWVQFALDRPMVEEPGAKFTYNSGGSHLLSAVVQKTTGMSTPAFAQAYLFEPLSITDVFWGTDPVGMADGAAGLWMKPRDMAKFGYLYLNNGAWEGQQVISADWVVASTREHIEAMNWGVDSGSLEYGYQWWIYPFGAYAARGYGGQRIFVQPEHELVVVFTSGLGWHKMVTWPDEFVASYILPAVKSTEPLPQNPTGVAQLTSLIKAVGQQPAPIPVLFLPETAQKVSGKTFILEDNLYGFQSFALDFQAPEAQLTLFIEDKPLALAVGLDNVFRITPVEQAGVLYGSLALKGAWRDEETFVLEMQFLNGPDSLDIYFTFIGEGAILWVRDAMFPEMYAEISRGTPK